MSEPAKKPSKPPFDPLRVWDRFGNESAAIRDLWAGSAGFLVCGGPSIKDIDYRRLAERGIVSLGINNISGMVPVKAATFSDPPEKIHHGILLDPAVMKLITHTKRTSVLRAKGQDGKFRWLNMLMHDCPNWFAVERSLEWRPTEFLTSQAATIGNNDGGVKATGYPKCIFTFFFGLRLMHYLGCRRVYLLGVDFGMELSRGKHGNYAFGEERDDGEVHGNNDKYRVANKLLVELRPLLDSVGFEVYNCNPKSRLEAFDHVPFEEAFADCKGPVPSEPFDLVGWYDKAMDDPSPKEVGRQQRRAARAARIAKREARKQARAGRGAGMPAGNTTAGGGGVPGG